MTDSEAEDEKWRSSVRQAVAHLPTDYAQAKERALRLRQILCAELAKALTPAFNQEVRARRPGDSYAAKRQLTLWANQEMRELDMCVAHPATNEATVLTADYQGGSDGSSRLRLESINGHDKRRRVMLPAELPVLQLRARPSSVDSKTLTQEPGSKGR